MRPYEIKAISRSDYEQYGCPYCLRKFPVISSLEVGTTQIIVCGKSLCGNTFIVLPDGQNVSSEIKKVFNGSTIDCGLDPHPGEDLDRRVDPKENYPLIVPIRCFMCDRWVDLDMVQNAILDAKKWQQTAAEVVFQRFLIKFCREHTEVIDREELTRLAIDAWNRVETSDIEMTNVINQCRNEMLAIVRKVLGLPDGVIVNLDYFDPSIVQIIFGACRVHHREIDHLNLYHRIASFSRNIVTPQIDNPMEKFKLPDFEKPSDLFNL